MSQKLHQLVYVSQGVDNLSSAEVKAIADKAQEANKKNNVTGILVYRDNIFLQLLEGDAYDVHYIFKKIRDDRRHTNVQIIMDIPVDARMFSTWNMLYKELDQDQKNMSSDLRDQVISLLEKPSHGIANSVLTALWKFYGAH